MNVFRLAGDLFHLSAMIALLLKICTNKSCAGVSGKTQILFAIVFSTRYIDLLFYYISLYNTMMKIIYLTLSYTTVFLIHKRYKATYDVNNDPIPLGYILLPVAVLSVLIVGELYIFKVLWTFSMLLEAVAMVPQLMMLARTKLAESITLHYIFGLGLYRFLYVLNWAYRYLTEGYLYPLPVVAGCVQTLLYMDFFYLYITRVLLAKQPLPA